MKKLDTLFGQNQKKRKKKGFSLLELLIVIAILAVLVTLSFSAYLTVQKKSRDAKRKSDLKEIQTALEQYYSVCSYRYPTPPGNFYTSIVCLSPNFSILPTVPLDPRATPYFCPTPVSSNCNADTYTLCISLEAESDQFCVSSQQ